MLDLDKLKALKESRGLTNEDIADVSGVPLSTVNRIFSGQTPNPLFDNVASIVIGLGGSLDEIVGLRSKNETPAPSRVEQTLSSYAELLKDKDDRIREKNDAIKYYRRERRFLLIFIAGFISVIVFVLLFDLLNGHVGYIRY